MNNKLGILFIIVAFLAVCGLWIGYAQYMCEGSCFNDWSTRGQFGDMYGALNTLFSGFAFVVLIYTLLLQKKSIDYQAKEINFVKKNMERQNDLYVLAARLEAITTLLNRELDKEFSDQSLVDFYAEKIESILKQLN